MKILSWNVNGLRAVAKKGWLDWFTKERADIVGIQETKAHPDQLMPELVRPGQYVSVFASAQKKGYSGTALYAKEQPDQFFESLSSIKAFLRLKGDSLGFQVADQEGRVVGLRLQKLLVLNAYFPNSQAEGARLREKLAFCEAMLHVLQGAEAKGFQSVLCGDFNIAHTPLDLTHPKKNTESPGYLPEERAWMDRYLDAGFCDGFRHFQPDPGHYTWWSYRSFSRERNVGWRVDYQTFHKSLTARVQRVVHQPETLGSDHCPVGLDIDFLLDL
jgi:exodeoxyribonuclease III